ncbi:MAG: AI-2E family transporter [Pirellulales bacterium]|nr:AI-2E family transporter [Pirellulales bacterium]
MVRIDSGTNSSRLLVLAVVISTIGALYFARGVLIPFALAGFLSFVLSPLVWRLERWRVPRAVAVVLVVTFAGSIVMLIGYAMAGQVFQLTQQLPQYKENLREKVEGVRSTTGGTFSRITNSIGELARELSHTSKQVQDANLSESAAPASGSDAQNSPRENAPVPVKVVEAPMNFVGVLQGSAAALLGSLGTLGVVVVLTVFMLLEREGLRNRVIALAGEGQLHVATQTIDEATNLVSRYLRMQLIINVTYGIAVGLGLWAIGLPNAALWGFLGAVLRFLPYVGPWVAALMPLSVSLAVSHGWTTVLLVAALFVVLELITNNVLEPWLYGSSTGVSPLGIITSAFFWTWLWGPIGLILATPLTVCLTVASRHVPQLRFVHILLSDEPALPTEARVYQRLLAVDQDEAQRVIDDYLAQHDLDQLYEAALLPALAQAERDHADGVLDDARRRFMLEFVEDLIDDIGSRTDGAAVGSPAANADVDESDATASKPRVLVAPAHSPGDIVAGTMLTQRLHARGIAVASASVDTLASEIVELVAVEQIALVALVAVSPISELHAKYLTKRLRRRFPYLKVIIGLWHGRGDGEYTQSRLKSAGADHVVTHFVEMLNLAERLVEHAPPVPTGSTVQAEAV